MEEKSFFAITAEAQSAIKDCKQTLISIENKIAGFFNQPAAVPETLERKIHNAMIRMELCRESARSTRALAERLDDPELRRQLLEMADGLDKLAE